VKLYAIPFSSAYPAVVKFPSKNSCKQAYPHRDPGHHRNLISCRSLHIPTFQNVVKFRR